MKTPRLQLHEILCELLGSRNCYFSPPSSLQMKYPCIRYELANTESTFADNRPYLTADRYNITVIDENPDSQIPKRVLELPYCISDRNYTQDNLNHFVFTLFY